ncbi:zinc transporter ZIP6 [Culicoides brevitarsis]|uniref:zinc transporter ZIP6 n=1 Tax=Culicoides brevitarsis TaxID=469753 RepID=UPI00307BBEE9
MSFKRLVILHFCVFFAIHAVESLENGSSQVLNTKNKNYNKFVRHIFNKYGSEGIINFEGLEHLMYNLGLGNLEFSVNHTVEVHRPEGVHIPGNLWDYANSTQVTSEWHSIVFKKLHGTHQHEGALLHPKTAIPRNRTKNCLSPLSIVSMSIDEAPVSHYHEDIPHRSKRHPVEYNEMLNDLKITPEMFLQLCPALIVQIDGHDCIEDPEPENPSTYTYFQAWIYASFSILIISLCGLFGLLIVPIAKSTNYNIILGFLVAIAVGTLLGDSLMHLLPHALVPHSHGHDDFHEHKEEKDENEPIYICLCALLAAVFMYSLENLMPLIGGGQSHNHSHGAKHHEKEETHEMTDANTQKRSKKLTPVAFMVVIGDGLHNITDGLAIGAAFVIDPITGCSTALAVLCHELPHELGDFALLLKTGVSIKRACHLNIVSSILSFIGMALGLVVSTEETAKWIYAATAGTFMYIALADLVPEMQKDKERGFKQILIQILGILIGCGIMLLIGLYEESLRFLFE